MEDNIKRIKEKTIPAICDFIEETCKSAILAEGESSLPEVIKGLSTLIKTIEYNKKTAHNRENEQSKFIPEDSNKKYYTTEKCGKC